MAAVIEMEIPQANANNESVENNACVKASGFEFCIRDDHSVWASNKDGSFLAISASIDILEKLVHPETGSTWLRLKVVSSRHPSRELICSAAKGAAGIARRLQEIGEFVRFKPAVAYIEELLAQRWQSLNAREMMEEEVLEADCESGLLLNLLAEFVRDFEQRFDQQDWGRIKEIEKEAKKETKVAILHSVMSEFFRRAKVPPEIQPLVLRKWRDDGKLEVDDDKKRFTKVIRVKGIPRRCYVVLLPSLPKPKKEDEEEWDAATEPLPPVVTRW